jgi:hypothetical protein
MTTEDTGITALPAADVAAPKRKPLTAEQKADKAAADKARRSLKTPAQLAAMRKNAEIAAAKAKTPEEAAAIMAKAEEAIATAENGGKPVTPPKAAPAPKAAAVKAEPAKVAPPKAVAKPAPAPKEAPKPKPAAKKAKVPPPQASLADDLLALPSDAPAAPAKAAATADSKAKFAATFGKGDPIRYLAFRIQTSLRTSKLRLSVNELADKMAATVAQCNQALELLKTESRVRTATVKGDTIYYVAP